MHKQESGLCNKTNPFTKRMHKFCRRGIVYNFSSVEHTHKACDHAKANLVANKCEIKWLIRDWSLHKIYEYICKRCRIQTKVILVKINEVNSVW